MTSPDASPGISRVDRDKTYRIIPSRYPPIDLFERLVSPQDWEALAEIESLTNDRLRDEMGQISLIPREERVAGPGATPINAAFAHPGPSRFSDGSYGVYYAGLELLTAIAESATSQARFYADSGEPPTDFEMRVHLGTVRGDLHDVRGGFEHVHDPESHVASRALGARLKKAGSFGVVYDSVRRKGGHCIAVFRPSILKNECPQGHTFQGPHFTYHWDGERVSKYFDFEAKRWQPIPSASRRRDRLTPLS